MTQIKTVCVYCGSGPGSSPRFVEAALALGKSFAENNIRLVYGGGSVGLMGTLARAALEAGGAVTGIIPSFLQGRERPMDGLTELIVTDDMHERKMIMYEQADAFVALPGGVGTLEELFEVWTWSQLGLHRKPVGLLNVEGYFDALIAFLDHQTDERFMRREHRDMLLVDGDPLHLLERFETYRPPVVEKWIRPSET